MDRYETDDEQVQAIKNWWKENGTSLLSGLLVISIGWAGWTYWSNTKMINSMNAANTFEMLQLSMEQGRFGDVAREGLKLIEEQPESPYAAASALMLAKFYVEKNETDKALAQFDWVIKNSTTPSIQLTAVLRATALHIEAKSFEDALAHLSIGSGLSLNSADQANLDYAYADYYLVKGDVAQAAVYLQKVIGNTDASANLLALAKLQLDDIGQ